MPELPEVETVRRIVGPQLAGRTVTGVDVRYFVPRRRAPRLHDDEEETQQRVSI